MAVRVNQFVEWQAGVGTPVKYSFAIDAYTDIVSRSGNTVTFSLNGTITIVNHPNNSQNSFNASDFAVLSIGTKNPGDYNFTTGTSYFQSALPFLPNAPQDYIDGVIAEFRGDTGRPNPNKSSLYINNAGLVLNADSSEFTRTFQINTTYTVELTGEREQPILAWIQSGAGSSTNYVWLTRQVWVYWADFDYRPGMIWDGNAWQSHNRNGGWDGIWDGASYREMRTDGAPTATGNPPSIFHDGNWFNMRKIGDNQ